MVLHDLLLLIETGDSWFLRLCFSYGLFIIVAETFLHVFLNARLRIPSWRFNFKLNFPVLSNEEFLLQKRQLEREIRVLQKEITSSTMLKERQSKTIVSKKGGVSAARVVIGGGAAPTGKTIAKTTQQTLPSVSSRASMRVDSDRFQSKKTSTSKRFEDKHNEIEDTFNFHDLSARRYQVLDDECHFNPPRVHTNNTLDNVTHTYSEHSYPPPSIPVHLRVPSAVRAPTFQQEDFGSRLSSNQYEGRTRTMERKSTSMSSNIETDSVRVSSAKYQNPRHSGLTKSQTLDILPVHKPASIPTKPSSSSFQSQHQLSGTKRKWDQFKSRQRQQVPHVKRPMRRNQGSVLLLGDQYNSSSSSSSSSKED